MGIRSATVFSRWGGCEMDGDFFEVCFKGVSSRHTAFHIKVGQGQTSFFSASAKNCLFLSFYEARNCSFLKLSRWVGSSTNGGFRDVLFVVPFSSDEGVKSIKDVKLSPLHSDALVVFNLTSKALTTHLQSKDLRGCLEQGLRDSLPVFELELADFFQD